MNLINTLLLNMGRVRCVNHIYNYGNEFNVHAIQWSRCSQMGARRAIIQLCTPYVMRFKNNSLEMAQWFFPVQWLRALLRKQTWVSHKVRTNPRTNQTSNNAGVQSIESSLLGASSGSPARRSALFDDVSPVGK